MIVIYSCKKSAKVSLIRRTTHHPAWNALGRSSKQSPQMRSNVGEMGCQCGAPRPVLDIIRSVWTPIHESRLRFAARGIWRVAKGRSPTHRPKQNGARATRTPFLLWCRWGDSNSHEGLPRRILNPLRLPFRHTGTCPSTTALGFRRQRAFKTYKRLTENVSQLASSPLLKPVWNQRCR